MADSEGTATIQDIAKQARVSPATVSRVITGSQPVSAKRQQAVLQAIEDLNYRPNTFARRLSLGRSMTIGILTPNIASPFFGGILESIEDELTRTAYRPLFVTGGWEQEKATRAVHDLIDQQVDGLVVIDGVLDDAYLIDVAAKKPLIAVGYNIPSLSQQCLRIDNRQGAYRAVQYLISLGHKQIAHITGNVSHRDTLERRQGYEMALSDAGLTSSPQLVVEGDYSEQAGLMGLEVLLNRGERFTAVFAGNDQIAAGVRLALFRRGIRIPQDISLIGFDDQPGSAYATPPLTTMRQPTFEMGRVAAQAICNLIDGTVTETNLFEAELVVRESVSFLR